MPTDPDDYYNVERIIDTKLLNDKRFYLIKWEGCPVSESTWEPAENCDCPDLIEEFLEHSQKTSELSNDNYEDNENHVHPQDENVNSDEDDINYVGGKIANCRLNEEESSTIGNDVEESTSNSNFIPKPNIESKRKTKVSIVIILE